MEYTYDNHNKDYMMIFKIYLTLSYGSYCERLFLYVGIH